jgi:predicted dehydrogenase
MLPASRRTFLGTLGALAAAGPAATYADAPSERVRLAILGVRGRGAGLADVFARNEGAEVVALCDVDDAAFAKAIKAVESRTGKAPRTEKDFRRLLDDKSIDAIVVAAPDHWHGPMTVLGCQAGKDVYCEKPACHNVVEGRRMVEAARKYGRVVQIGTQRRSSPSVQQAVEFVRSGKLGKVGLARAWIHQQRGAIGHGEPGPVPAGVDYAMWQGPAPDRPFHENRFHYNWHWFWNWGTGELGNNGIHGLDVARWGLDVDAPVRVASGGGKFVFDDDQEVPDTQVVTYEFPHTSIVWEHRMWSKHGLEGSPFGIAFYGDKGTLIVDGSGWKVVDGPAADAAPDVKPSDGMTAHAANWLECIRTRQRPNADVEIGHLSTRLCHLGNIAHRVGRKLAFDAATETFPGDAEANALLAREYSPRYELPSQV